MSVNFEERIGFSINILQGSIKLVGGVSDHKECLTIIGFLVM